MDISSLNLARKWRSRNFDQIIGQDLAVKMLKNSLFLNQYFPVYLFAGQKGCGKTSTARVFAAAVNCQKLALFQKEPKSTPLPCLECISCKALIAGSHPDFIEIDAASNTGVDNVRHIIDSCSLLPLIGPKKIYLIDEAHMLSKAAFNAFLKLMEEPPSSVLFILATTDTQKIIETVRSRCFQLFFKSIEPDSMVKHLAYICESESIAYEADALSIIAKATQGSARDALNLLEQVRFSDVKISAKAVYHVLGQLDQTRLMQLFEILLHKMPLQLLDFSKTELLEKYSAELLWQQLTELVRACIWIKYGVSPREFADMTPQLQFLSRTKSVLYLNKLLELFYTNELLFKSTTAQYAFLEMLLLRICQKNESNSNSNVPAMAYQGPIGIDSDEEVHEEATHEESELEQIDPTDAVTVQQALWRTLVDKTAALHDPLLTSLFAQGKLAQHNTETRILTVEFPKELSFFSDVFETTKPQWQPLFSQVIGYTIELQCSFTLLKAEAAPATALKKQAVGLINEPRVPVVTAKSTSSASPLQGSRQYPTSKKFNSSARVSMRPLEQKVDISDTTLWPQAHLLVHYFPGTVTQMKEAS